ncbi:MAG: proprotein convertase P-domain-containing protein [Pirellulales bacterium]|nr:proprotein convertase P-domain-containing protein [Pirellulales bacterium]
MAVVTACPPPDPALFQDSSVLAGGAALVPPLPVDLTETFFLHSRPESENVIFLDFDGHITQDTPWNGDPTDPESQYIPTIVTPPYSQDNNGLFTDAELETIQRIWARVVEDFAPFDVDVTTEDPGSAYIATNGIRVIIGGVDSNWYSPPNDPAGGVALIGSFAAGADVGCFAFSGSFGGNEKATAEVISHETGHTLGLAHWGQVVPGEDDPIEYYGGDAGWAPIMGVGYSQFLTTWAKGEYHLATNVPIPDPPNLLQDDLAVISLTLPFVADDHGDDYLSATPLDYTGTTFFGEGLITGSEGIGRNDMDFFSFDLGIEEVTFQISPALYGPNLDILATLYDSDGIEIDSFNLQDYVDASFSINTTDPDTLFLQPGRYYISIDGTGRPFTTGQGYSDYGSLGAYSIEAQRKSHLGTLIGVDFDPASGNSPLNWTRYKGSSGPAVLSDVINELGIETPVNLSISSSNMAMNASTSTADPASVPLHPQSLEEVGGFISDTNVTWTFTWSDLTPLAVYEVYVFGLNNEAAGNLVTINGFQESINFEQSLDADELVVNGQPGVIGRQLVEYARTLRATAAGTIEIIVSNMDSMEAGIAGLALRLSTPGSISGTKWNDLNGDGLRDLDEPGLPGWTIFIDENGNGIMDSQLPQTVVSDDIPLNIIDEFSQKSELFFSGIRAIADVDVFVDISHTYDGDIDLYLISPSGTRVELSSDNGGSGDHYTNTTFDDEAPTSVTLGAAPFAGHYRPEVPLSTLDGEDANGIWTLEVRDDSPSDTGILHSWSITITGSETFTLTDQDGNYEFPDLAPGNYIIGEVQQVGWTATFLPPPVTLTSGADVLGIDFGNTQGAVAPEQGLIAGQKWNDLNGDGLKDGGEPGLPGWVIYIDQNNNGQFDQAVSQTLASADVPQPIEDFETVISELEFHGLASITDLNVSLDIAHTFAGDLDVFLVSPAGTQVELFSGVGGQFDNFTGTIIDDEAPDAIVTADAPFTGSFRPEGWLGTFDGENPDGIWKLLIRDTALADEGSLLGWSLTIVGQEISTTTNAEGNYQLVGLREGDYVVREAMQDNWIQTLAPQPIALNPNQQVTGADFGNRFKLFGDYNSDGTVDAGDYLIWRRTLGTTGSAYSGADGDGDGTVDADDYNVWRAHFGATLPPGPGSGAVLAAGGSVETGSTSSDESQAGGTGFSGDDSPMPGGSLAGGQSFASLGSQPESGSKGDAGTPNANAAPFAMRGQGTAAAPAASPTSGEAGRSFRSLSRGGNSSAESNSENARREFRHAAIDEAWQSDELLAWFSARRHSLKEGTSSDAADRLRCGTEDQDRNAEHTADSFFEMLGHRAHARSRAV